MRAMMEEHRRGFHLGSLVRLLFLVIVVTSGEDQR